MIYLYGMIMSTYSFMLKYGFPEIDGTGIIDKKYHLLGGETGTSAAVLKSLGADVKVGGTHLGNENKDIILKGLEGVDTTELVYEDYDGVVDYVFISGDTRTCFGEWENVFSRQTPFYEPPSEQSVKSANVIGADPFFGSEVARLAGKYSKPYATIDCPHDSEMNRYCEINAVSHQYLKGTYPDVSFEELHRKYTDNTDGLVIFTRGSDEVLYGRKNQEIKRFKQFSVNAVSTLGAGDCFKAGTIYALDKGMSDDEIVRFACAVSAAAITKFPIPINPPTLDEVLNLINNNPKG